MRNLKKLRKDQLLKIDYLGFLRNHKMHYKSRWVVKYNAKELIKEVKLIFNPERYRKRPNAKKLHTQKGLIKILQNDKEKRNTQLLCG
jgi:hypothetical protein